MKSIFKYFLFFVCQKNVFCQFGKLQLNNLNSPYQVFNFSQLLQSLDKFVENENAENNLLSLDQTIPQDKNQYDTLDNRFTENYWTTSENSTPLFAYKNQQNQKNNEISKPAHVETSADIIYFEPPEILSKAKETAPRDKFDSEVTTPKISVNKTTPTNTPSKAITKEKADLSDVNFASRNKFQDELVFVDPANQKLSTATPPPPFKSTVSFNTRGNPPDSCKTVDGDNGSCVSINSCKPYMKLLPEAKTKKGVVELLRQAQCGFEGKYPKVCCPPEAVPSLPASTERPRTVSEPPKPATSTASNVSLLLTPDPKDHVPSFPQPPVCGSSNATFSRVVGGENAKLGDLPWMALLGYRERGVSTSFRCGGSLISTRHVLTAAHCIQYNEDKLYVVRLGELDLAREDDGAFPVDVLIKTLIKHEEYNVVTHVNDIGVLVLERDVQFTDYIKPICLPLSAEMRELDFVDYSPTIAGWGALRYRGPSASHLQVLQVPVVSNAACTRIYSPYKSQVQIDDRSLCAGYLKGGKDSCQGDSGGPLIQPLVPNPKTFKSYYYAIGVISFGVKCAEPGYPGVYSRVTRFVPWLQKVVLGTV